MYDSVLRRLATARPSRRHPGATQATCPARTSRPRRCWPACRTSAGSGRKSKSAPGPRSRRRSGSGWTTCDSARRSIASRPARADTWASACRRCCAGSRPGRWCAARPDGGRWWPACAWWSASLPRQPGLDALVRELSPDVVLLTPVLRLGSSQVEVLRSARAFGARTAICVASWDHLSSKARIADDAGQGLRLERYAADRSHHPARRARVPRGGHWRAVLRPVVRPRAGPVARSLLRQAGPAGRPAVPAVRVLGALAGSADRSRVSSSDGSNRCGPATTPCCGPPAMLVRPHPQRLAEWREVDLSHLSGVTVYGSHPLDDAVEGGLLRLAVSLRRPSSGC